MTDDSSLTVRPGISIPRGELSWRFSRSSGPGGQSVNTTDSRVELSWDLLGSSALPASLKELAVSRLARRLRDGVLTVTGEEHRSQLINRRLAEEKLVAVVKRAIEPGPPRRRPTKPTRSSVRRRLDTKRRRSDTKRLRRSTDD
ncbi:aminoacyl-tRNA hydrolase [Flindersiella endophytica]